MRQTVQELQASAGVLKREAVRQLLDLYGLRPPTSADAHRIEAAIDCIVGAAMLEMSAVYSEAAKDTRLNRSTSDNP